MVKSLFIGLLAFCFIFAGGMAPSSTKVDSIKQASSFVASIELMRDGSIKEYKKNSLEFYKIMIELSKMLEGAEEQPALGVSIDALTREEMKMGDWVQINFKKELSHRNMNFSRLLFQVKPNYYGFNIIRYTEEYGYQGRCFYVVLNNKTMAEFSENINKFFR